METINRLGILGGSFDPIHNAHYMLAKQAMEQFHLDLVWFMPSGVSYHKGHGMTDTAHRVRMIELAIAEEPRFSCSDLDISRTGNTYTADTLRIVKERYPHSEVFFLMGADSLMHIENWYRPDVIFECATIIAARRPGHDDIALLAKREELKERFQARIEMLDVLYTDISSSHIRHALLNGESLEDFLSKPVEEYIYLHGLYQDVKPMHIDEITGDLKRRLKPSRFLHTMGVADTAAALAKHYGFSVEKAYLTGLLHDCAKYMSADEEIKCANMADIPLTEVEIACPALIHAKLGAYYAKERYHIRDEEILDAIRYHTTGRPDMTWLECIIYIADYIEPQRKEAPHLSELREMAYHNLDATIAQVAADTLSYLEQKGSVIDELSRKTCNFYQTQVQKERSEDE